MVRRTTWILLIIFALLVGFAYLFQRNQTDQPASTVTATLEPSPFPVMLYSLTSDQLKQIKITNDSGASINIYLDPASSSWVIAGLPVDQVDSDQIHSLITQLLSIQVQETLAQSVPFESVGLVSPAHKISMTTSDGTQLYTFIGSPTAIGSGYYVRLDSGPVVIVDKSELMAVLDLVNNPPMRPTSTPELTPSETGTSIAP